MRIKINKKTGVLILLLIIIFGIGYWFGSGAGSTDTDKDHQHSESSYDDDIQFWTCSMHPQVKQPGPGQCPICGMDLIPVYKTNTNDLGPRQITISESAKKLAEIVTTKVERKFVDAEIRMVGKIDFDETRLKYITTWMPGRIDKLYVDYTGVQVKKGDHMVRIYSPELYTAQEELLQAKKTVSSFKNTQMKASGQITVEASREKLKLFGLTDYQIKQIEKRGTPSYFLTLYSPLGGTVIEKNVYEGMYVKTGTKIYTIADLTKLWMKLDAYESDIAWLKYGQKVIFTTEAYQGEQFTGRISFIDPVVNQKTRTVKIRVNINNKDEKLKPEMFVRAIVKARIAADNKIVESELSGKWIGPMHPDIIHDNPGKCPVCGMPLVRTETLGYLNINKDKGHRPLVIPVSAPLLTGKRAIVYVKVPDTDRPTYESREVVLGPRAGNYYIVVSGLKESEEVVTNGNFKLDSAVQIETKPSMMNPAGGMSSTGHHHGSMQKMVKFPEKMDIPNKFLMMLKPVYSSYYSLHSSLTKDNVRQARMSWTNLSMEINKIDMSLLKGTEHNNWMKIEKKIKGILNSINVKKTNLKVLRAKFKDLSDIMINLENVFGHIGNQKVYNVHCPMAFNNKGANWLQKGKDIKNPYYGTKMLKCGDITKTYDGVNHVK